MKILKKILRNIKYRKLDIDEGSSIGRKSNITNFKNIKIGKNSAIGDNNTFLNLLASVNIGNYVMTGPEVMFITGNHRTDLIGKYMIEIGNSEKKEDNDQNIIIKDDVWIGARAIILKGIKISEGSIIQAGSLVYQDVPKYTIYLSNGKMVPRFSEEEIEEHERLLNNRKELFKWKN